MLVSPVGLFKCRLKVCHAYARWLSIEKQIILYLIAFVGMIFFSSKTLSSVLFLLFPHWLGRNESEKDCLVCLMLCESQLQWGC